MATASNTYLNQLDLGFEVEKRVTNSLYLLQHSSKLFLGLLGLILISIPLLALVPLIYGLLVYSNRKLDKQLDAVYNWINTAPTEDLVNAHLIVERKNKGYKSIRRKNMVIDKNPLTMGVSSISKKIINKHFELESALKKAAYPKIDQEISKENLEELSNLFAGVNDWQDESLDVYENYI